MLIVSWFARLSRGWTAVFAAAAPAASDNFAGSLLQTANDRAGLDPHDARQLRDAAQAWLSVVR